MNRKSFALSAVLMFSMVWSAHAGQKTLFQFDEPDASRTWRTVNDGVMGGRSVGRFEINDEKNLVFYGTLSLQNNGGFASVRAWGDHLSMSKDDAIIARVKGDGRSYWFNVYTRRNSGAFSFRQTFKTEKDKWVEIRLPVDQFVASWFGRPVPLVKLDPAQVTGMGFLLADKKPGPFKLEIDWIKTDTGRNVIDTGATAVADRSGDDIVETAARAKTFKTLLAAARAAGLVDTLKSDGPFTVFAPTDKAFSKLPEGTVESLLKPENKSRLAAILKYHVVPGRVSSRQAASINSAETVLGESLDVTYLASSNPDRVPSRLLINDATVIRADIQARNGLIHVIDSVLMPKKRDLVQTAREAGSFKTLLAAAEAAGLVETLKSKGPFTVLAPTDEAFSRLPEGTVAALLKKENRSRLKKILTYHVIPGRFVAADVSRLQSARTAAGSSVPISACTDGIRIGGARVVKADIAASNGLIHVIDSVLIPKAMSPRSAMQTIRRAIDAGVPMYNRGDHQGCAELYKKACLEILGSAGEQVPDHAVRSLRTAVQKAGEVNHDARKAWILRYGMDDAYHMMQRQMFN